MQRFVCVAKKVTLRIFFILLVLRCNLHGVVYVFPLPVKYFCFLSFSHDSEQSENGDTIIRYIIKLLKQTCLISDMSLYCTYVCRKVTIHTDNINKRSLLNRACGPYGKRTRKVYLFQ